MLGSPEHVPLRITCCGCKICESAPFKEYMAQRALQQGGTINQTVVVQQTTVGMAPVAQGVAPMTDMDRSR